MDIRKQHQFKSIFNMFPNDIIVRCVFGVMEKST